MTAGLPLVLFFPLVPLVHLLRRVVPSRVTGWGANRLIRTTRPNRFTCVTRSTRTNCSTRTTRLTRPSRPLVPLVLFVPLVLLKALVLLAPLVLLKPGSPQPVSPLRSRSG